MPCKLGLAIKVEKDDEALERHFDKAKVDPRRKLCEFRVTKDALVPIGTEISGDTLCLVSTWT